MDTDTSVAPDPEPLRCAECGTTLAPGDDHIATEDATFCRPCFNNLTEQLRQATAAQQRDINYPMAFVGGVAGAALGVLVWWGFTVVTKIAFGLIAIVIGFAAGKGVVMLSGNKRGRGLQVMAVSISVVGFFYAQYLVMRTFFQRGAAGQGQELVLPLLPDPGLFVQVIQAGFSMMDLIFLAIVVWEAWKLPAPMDFGE